MKYVIYICKILSLQIHQSIGFKKGVLILFTYNNHAIITKEFQARSFCLSYSAESPERIGTEGIYPLLFLADTTLL